MRLLLKILLPVTLLIMILVGVSGYVSFVLSSGSLEEAVLADMHGEADAIKRISGVVLGNSRMNVQRFADSQSVRDFFAGDIRDKESQIALGAQLQGIVDSYNDMDRINIFDKNGIIVSSSNTGVIGQDFKTRPYFTEALAGKVFVSAPFKSTITGEGVIIISAPIYSDRAIVGVLNATVPLPEYYNTVIKPVSVGERGYAYAMDENGVIVLHANSAWLFRNDLPGMENYKKMASSPDGKMEFKNAAGLQCIAYHVKEPLSGMTLVVQAETDDVYTDLNTLAKTSIGTVAGAILLGVLLLFILIVPIVRALNKGVAFATDVAKGKLDGTLSVRRKDEIGILADALRSIPASLKSIIAEYARLEEELVSGKIEIQGDASKFAGDFSGLVQGTNNMLALYQHVLNSLTLPVAVLDKDLRVIYMNAAGKSMAGDNYMGKTSGEVIRAEDYGTPASALQKAANSMRPATAETVAHPQGKRMDISYTAIPLPDKKGKLSIVLQLITDLTEIKNVQRTIMNVADQAGEISSKLASASEQLSAQVSQVSSGAEVQRMRAASTATAMEEMNSTVLEVARNAAAASEQAEATNNKATEGAALVGQVVSSITQVSAVAAEVDRNMRQLGTQTDAIGSVLNVISDIADQTNLLALNAAIEAARAGEAGRGFAVVADEVRKLAEKTMHATTEVETNIKTIQNSTATNIVNVSKAGEGVFKATEVAQVSGKALDSILELAQSTSAVVSSIATAAEEQSATSEEINNSVEDINRIAEETAEGMKQAAKAVQEVARMAQELQALLAKLH